jgi:lipopolysaccharide export system protein LptC
MGTNLTAASHSASMHAWSATGPRELSGMLRRARRHSARVRLLRKAIPAGAAGALGALVLAAWLKPLSAIPELPVSIDSVVVQGTKITMEAPRLTGFTRDNRPYKVTAEAAAQDIANPTVLELSGIKGTTEMQSKATVDVTAIAGLYDTKSEQLTLSQHIHVVSSDGYEGFLTEARIDVRSSRMTSEKPVEILLPNGKLNGNRLEVHDSGALVRFDGGVKLVLKPSALPPAKPAPSASSAKKRAAAAPAPPPPPSPMQGFALDRDQPAEITATTLELRDKDKRATFIGDVVVVQGDTTMKANLLDVFYDQQNDPSAPASAVASGPSQNAQIRLLEAKGGVVVTQKDQSATGDMVIFDMKANTATFVNNVTITQGPQVIRGDRLTSNLTTGESVIQGGERGVQAVFVQNQPGKAGEARRGTPKPAQIAGAGQPNALQGFAVNRELPVKITSSKLEVLDKQKRAIFVGNVIVAQGDTMMKARTLEVSYDQDGDPSAPMMGPEGATQVRRLEAKGGVVVTQNDRTATGEVGIFEVQQNTVTLLGGVVMTQGPQVMRGERLTVNLTTGESLVEGRAQTLILPNRLKAGGLRDGNGKPGEPEARPGDNRPGDAQAGDPRAGDARSGDVGPEPARRGAPRPAARSMPGEPLRLN